MRVRRPAEALHRGAARAQRLAGDERHRIVEERSCCGRGRNDQRVLQLRGELDLAAESLDADFRGQLGWEEFDDTLRPRLVSSATNTRAMPPLSSCPSV